LGTASGGSLIIGAIVGCRLAPVSDLSCSAMMAFGAGALLFAVTIELYAHALHELRSGHISLLTEFCVILISAMIGAMFYLWINRHLEKYMLGDEEEGTASEMAAETRSSQASENTPLVDKSSGQAGGSASSTETPEEKKKRLKDKAKAMWCKARTSVKFTNFVKLQAMRNVRGREKGMRHLMVEIQRMASKIGLDSPRPSQMVGKSNTQLEFESEERSEIVKRAKLVAMQLFLGLLVDGVPEAILMGFLAARGHLTPVFIIALFFANFPEAFSSASLLTVARLSWWGIVGMWTFLCLLVGVVAGMSCWALLALYPGYATGEPLPLPVLMGIASIEGLTGGSMIACIAAVMLPEAFERMGKEPPLLLSSGMMCALGFLSAVLLKALTD
jgi:zinc transporter ZupT